MLAIVARATAELGEAFTTCLVAESGVPSPRTDPIPTAAASTRAPYRHG